MLNVIWVVAAVLTLLWVLRFATSYTMGLIHVLLMLAVVAVLLRVIMGRRVA